MPRVSEVNEIENNRERHVIGNKKDTAVTTAGDTASLAAYAKGIINSKQDKTGVGTVFSISKLVTASALLTSGNGIDLTGVSSVGDLLVEDVIVATAVAAASSGGAATLNVRTNNVYGGTLPFFKVHQDLLPTNGGVSLNADVAAASEDKLTSRKAVLEVGKKLIAQAGTEAFTGAAVFSVTVILRRLTAGATIAAA